jgi:hypothetical protein
MLGLFVVRGCALPNLFELKHRDEINQRNAFYNGPNRRTKSVIRVTDQRALGAHRKEMQRRLEATAKMEEQPTKKELLRDLQD